MIRNGACREEILEAFWRCSGEQNANTHDGVKCGRNIMKNYLTSAFDTQNHPTNQTPIHILNKWQIEFHISHEWLVIDIQWPATTTTFGPDFPARKLPNQRLRQLARRWKKDHFASIKLIRDRIIVAFISCSHTYPSQSMGCACFFLFNTIYSIIESGGEERARTQRQQHQWEKESKTGNFPSQFVQRTQH